MELTEYKCSNLPKSLAERAVKCSGTVTLIDMLYTASASLNRSAKAISWATGGDPLVLDLGGNGLETTALAGSHVHFDLNNDFFSERTGWLWKVANNNIQQQQLAA